MVSLQVFGRRRPRSEALSEPRRKVFVLRVSQAERDLLKIAAEVNHQSPSEFARLAILGAANDCLEEELR